MVLEANLQKMAKHLATILERDKTIIVDSNDAPVFASAIYGEPRVIELWPLCSIQPLRKLRELKTTHKFEVELQIEIYLYWGKVSSTLEVQEELHDKVEALEDYLDSDRHWNFEDAADSSKNKVIWGHSVELDHPVLLTENELWSVSRLRLVGLSEETFRQ